MRQVAAYARISKDEAQDGLGIERQMDAIEKRVADEGWAIDARWHLGETASAFKSRPRPLFERLLEAMRRGEVTTLVTYSPDRLTRRTMDYARVLQVVEDTGCEVYFAVGGDLLDGRTRGTAGIVAAVASMETGVMSERHRVKNDQIRRSGGVTNGGRRSFGYELDRMTPVEAEFALLREAHDRLIAGDSLRSIVTDWNRREVRTATDRGEGRRIRWQVKTLRETLSRQRLCGRVVKKERVRRPDGTMGEQEVLVTDEAGRPVVGRWPAVFTPEEFDRLQVVLAARKTMGEGWTAETKHLLTGLLTCGACGGKMVSEKQRSGRLTYRCRDAKHLSRDEINLDRHVLAVVQQWVSNAEIPVETWVRQEDADIARRRGDLEQRREDAIHALVRGTVQASTTAEIVAAFDREIETLRALQVETVVQQFETVSFDSFPDLAEMPFQARRKFLRMCLRGILVKPTRRGRGFNPDDVEIVMQPGLRVERAWNTETGYVEMTLRRDTSPG